MNGPTIERHASTLPFPFAEAVLAGGFAFLSGQIAMDPNGRLIAGTIEEETPQVLTNIQTALAALDLDRTDVLRCTVWLSSFEEFGGFNAVYREFFADVPSA